MKEQRAKDAVAQTEAVHQTLAESTDALAEKFTGVSMNVPGSAEDLPCAQFRKETLQCYKKAGAETPPRAFRKWKRLLLVREM